MDILTTQPPLDDWLGAIRSDSGRHAGNAPRRVALVPTMGALHDGHGALVRLAGEHADVVLASVFVNPTQFGPNEDFGRYPRDLAADAAKLAKWGAAAVFAPDTATMYPHGFLGVRVEPAPGLVKKLCGPRRPGHFSGVLTVVLKLFHLVRPDVAVFGQKDYQQFRVIADMVADLRLPVALVRAPIVRDRDGQALSSRNAYLAIQERSAALVINRTLAAILSRYMNGERCVANLETFGLRVWRQIAGEWGGTIELEYLEVLDGLTLSPVELLDKEGVAAIAAQIGATRLIDNVALIPDSPDRSLLAFTNRGCEPQLP